jgi:hypothetical protein
LKESLEKKANEIIIKIDQILRKVTFIEEKILPDVTKIADDDDEKEILKSKIDILRDVKTTA